MGGVIRPEGAELNLQKSVENTLKVSKMIDLQKVQRYRREAQYNPGDASVKNYAAEYWEHQYLAIATSRALCRSLLEWERLVA